MQATRPRRFVAVLDFGAQYGQLIARRVRDLHVYSELVPCDITADELTDAIRRFGATELDMRRLRALLGDGRLRSLLSTAGVYEGGPRELAAIDELGHAALIERS